jgi:hypothetical protein
MVQEDGAASESGIGLAGEGQVAGGVSDERRIAKERRAIGGRWSAGERQNLRWYRAGVMRWGVRRRAVVVVAGSGAELGPSGGLHLGGGSQGAGAHLQHA